MTGAGAEFSAGANPFKVSMQYEFFKSAYFFSGVRAWKDLRSDDWGVAGFVRWRW